MLQCESLTRFFQRTDRDGRTALFFPMDIPRRLAPMSHRSDQTSASVRKDFSISRTGGDPLNMGNDISMDDPGNDVFSTIPPLKLARMGCLR